MKNYAAIRRNWQFLILSVLLIATAVYAFYAQSVKKAEAPVFSAQSGFYEEAFYLELTAPEGCSIYYTLDSTNPDRTSLRYTGPIYIDNATGNENVYSMTEGMSVRNWSVPPDYLVDKCTVVRAVAIPDAAWNAKKSQTVTQSFFVGFRAEDFQNCGVISLVTDPDNLFDSKNGIYVAGDKYRQYLATTKDPEELSWAYRPANYREKGRKWEREANMTVWDADGNLVLNKDIGIRTQGGWTRAYVPRSLNLYAREEYDGTTAFEYDFFGTSHQLQKLNLSVGGNAYITRMNDYLMSQRIGELPFSTMSFRPYVMFLDGEYWGFYWLSEKMDESWFRHYYSVEEDNTVFIKFRTKAREDLVEVGLPEDEALFDEMEAFFLEHDMADPANYEKAQEIIDLDSCIDYYAAMIYIARRADWPDGNIGYWRVRTPSGQGYSDGKWRWVIFDCNGTCMRGGVDAATGAILEAHETLDYVLETDEIFASLWRNPQFREDFRERILELADTCFDADTVSAFVDEYAETMKPIMEKSWARFYGSENDMGDQFDFIVSTYHQFFQTRKAYVESWFED